MKLLLLSLIILPNYFGFICAQTISERLDTFMTASLRANEFNGAVLVARNDSILLSKGYGWRDMENKIPHVIN